jgi:hypothetical protein
MMKARNYGRSESSAVKLDWARDRRARLKDLGLCINNEAHGPATHGVLCAACRETHRHGKGQGRTP